MTANFATTFFKLFALENNDKFHDLLVMWFIQTFDEMFPETGKDNPRFSRNQIRHLVFNEFLFRLDEKDLASDLYKILNEKSIQLVEKTGDFNEGTILNLHVNQEIFERILNKYGKIALQQAFSKIQDRTEIDSNSPIFSIENYNLYNQPLIVDCIRILRKVLLKLLEDLESKKNQNPEEA